MGNTFVTDADQTIYDKIRKRHKEFAIAKTGLGMVYRRGWNGEDAGEFTPVLDKDKNPVIDADTGLAKMRPPVDYPVWLAGRDNRKAAGKKAKDLPEPGADLQAV